MASVSFERKAHSEPERTSLLGHPRARAIVIAVVMAVALVSLIVGFTDDDYGFRASLDTGLRRSFDLYGFSSGRLSDNLHLIEQGTFPWWVAPDFKLRFFRPLASLMLTLDCALFGHNPLGYHLVALALYLAVLLGVGRVFDRFLPAATANLALLVYGLRSAHVQPYAWICADHMLVGVAPAVFGFLAYVRAVQDKWRPGRPLALALFVVALAGSETALWILPFWGAFAFVQARASGDWRRMVRDGVWVGLLVALYLVVYHFEGCGSHSAGFYVDPFTSPRAFLRVTATRVPTFLGDALLGFPTDAGVPPIVHVVLGVGGILLCAALFFTTRTMTPQERAALAWMVPAAVLAACLGSASGRSRLLIVPDLGFSALIGVLLLRGLDRFGERPLRRAGRLAATAGLAVAHLVAAPIVSLVHFRDLAREVHRDEAIAADAELGPTLGQRVFVMAASDRDVLFYPKEIITDTLPGRVACWSSLSAAAAPHRLTRTGDREFVLETTARPEGYGYDEQYFSNRVFAVGDLLRQCGASIRVDRLDHEMPSRLTIALDEPLEGEDLTLLEWDGERLRRFRPPAVGQAVELPWARALPRGHVGSLVGRVRSAVRAVFAR